MEAKNQRLSTGVCTLLDNLCTAAGTSLAPFDLHSKNSGDGLTVGPGDLRDPSNLNNSVKRKLPLAGLTLDRMTAFFIQRCISADLN